MAHSIYCMDSLRISFHKGLAKVRESKEQGTINEIPKELEPPTSTNGTVVLQVHKQNDLTDYHYVHDLLIEFNIK